MSVNGEIHNAYNLYNITNIVTIVPRGNITKETNNCKSIEQRNNSSAEETLKTFCYQSKGSCKHSKTDWSEIYKRQSHTRIQSNTYDETSLQK